MQIDESQLASLIEEQRAKSIVAYDKKELDAFEKETERAGAYVSNQLCLPKAALSKILLIRNNLIAMHHEVAEPDFRQKNIDFRSVQAHWKTGEVTVTEDNYTTDQCLFHLIGCFAFKTRLEMVQMLEDRYLHEYKSDEDDPGYGLCDDYEYLSDGLKPDSNKDSDRVEKELVDKEKFDKKKLSLLGKRRFDEMQLAEKNRKLVLQLEDESESDSDADSHSHSHSHSHSDSDSDSDSNSNLDSDLESSKFASIEFNLENEYDEMEFGHAAEDFINDFSRWFVFCYTPMKREDFDGDEFPINCSRIELDLEKKRVLFAWCFSYDEDVGNLVLQKSEILNVYFGGKVCIRTLLDRLNHFDWTAEDYSNSLKEYLPEVNVDDRAYEVLTTRRPFFDTYLRKKLKSEDHLKKCLKLVEKRDILGRHYSVVYNPHDDKLYFYDPVTKRLEKEWIAELSFKQCRQIARSMLDIWIAEDRKMDEMKDESFYDNINKKLKI